MEHSVYDSFSIRLAIILKNDLLNNYFQISPITYINL